MLSGKWLKDQSTTLRESFRFALGVLLFRHAKSAPEVSVSVSFLLPASRHCGLQPAPRQKNCGNSGSTEKKMLPIKKYQQIFSYLSLHIAMRSSTAAAAIPWDCTDTFIDHPVRENPLPAYSFLGRNSLGSCDVPPAFIVMEAGVAGQLFVPFASIQYTTSCKRHAPQRRLDRVQNYPAAHITDSRNGT